MSFTIRTALPVIALALAASCAGVPGDEGNDDEVSETASAITLPGLGHYCSGTWANGGWAFSSDSNGNDPCASIIATGGTVKRKGLWANNAMNRVVYRCYPPGYGWVGIYEGFSGGPMSAAFTAAQGRPGCIFNVSPVNLPIFDAPFSLATSYTHVSGVDFARSGLPVPPTEITYNVAEFGQIGSPTASIVDWLGRDKSGQYINNHDGHDFNMDRGTPILAAADGVVVMSRAFASGCTYSDSPWQLEVTLEHKVQRVASSSYYEKFQTYYAHFSSIDPAIVVGATVHRGQLLGLSGMTGCASPAHLHFGTVRLTNTADQLEETVHFFADSRHSDATDKGIEPYGWGAPSGFDPFAYRQYPQGALSVNLWNPGQAPFTGNW